MKKFAMSVVVFLLFCGVAFAQCSINVVGGFKGTAIVEYDKGNTHYTKDVKPGSSLYVPQDARNVKINGQIVPNDGHYTITSGGALTKK